MTLANSFGHAVVIGSSIAGLVTARVLSDYFKQVTVLERDRFPDAPLPRKGVPQSTQAHVLLQKGQALLEELFPGLEAELIQQGSPSVNWTQECAIFGYVNWEASVESNLVTRTCSRSLLEWAIRKQVAAFPNISIQPGQPVQGLISNRDRTHIIGVQGEDQPWIADLVVDASGRNSNAVQWLEALGYEAPPESRVNSFLGYASRWYHYPGLAQHDWKSMVIWNKAPEAPRGGMIYPIEGDRIIVNLMGVGRDYPPTDEAGFFNFAHHLRSPVIAEVMQAAEPITPIYAYRRTENQLRHFDRLTRRPENFVVLGDAACAFNPIYGQGMTVATLGAIALGTCLRRYRDRSNLNGLAQRFQKQLAKVIATPWNMATAEDLRWKTTEGGKADLLIHFLHWYFDQIRYSTQQNPIALKTFVEVIHLMKSPIALFHPQILVSVCQYALVQAFSKKTSQLIHEEKGYEATRLSAAFTRKSS